MRPSIFALICLSLIACDGDDPGAEPPGRGTAACRDVQDALCDFGADRCHVVDRATCDAMFQGIECKDDAVASNCANALNSATCTSGGVAGCNLEAIVDPAPAVARCNALVDAVCERTAECGVSSADCSMDAMQGFSCDQAIAIDLRYEMCLEAIDTIACEGFALPPSCMDVVRVLPPM